MKFIHGCSERIYGNKMYVYSSNLKVVGMRLIYEFAAYPFQTILRAISTSSHTLFLRNDLSNRIYGNNMKYLNALIFIEIVSTVTAIENRFCLESQSITFIIDYHSANK